ncbi:hypothetical protein ACOMHN_045709 [Nucella lapillus]
MSLGPAGCDLLQAPLTCTVSSAREARLMPPICRLLAQQANRLQGLDTALPWPAPAFPDWLHTGHIGSDTVSQQHVVSQGGPDTVSQQHGVSQGLTQCPNNTVCHRECLTQCPNNTALKAQRPQHHTGPAVKETAQYSGPQSTEATASHGAGCQSEGKGPVHSPPQSLVISCRLLKRSLHFRP